jgi:hypothetical protein
MYMMNKRWMWKLYFTMISVVLSDSALAGEQGPGLITDLQIEGNRAVFAVGGQVVNKPACAVWGRFVFDVTTPSGQALLAYLLSAQASGKKVRVYGTGDCSLVGDHETAFGLRDGE